MYPGLGGQQPGGYNTGGYNPGGYNASGYNPSAMAGYNPGAPPPTGPGYISPEIQQWFNAVDRDQSGKINSEELQAALVNGQGKNFSTTACKLMISMFDQDHSGTIDVNEFQQLYSYVNQWINVFRMYDRDQSGEIEQAELSQALQQMGFRFSPEFTGFLLQKFDQATHSKMSVDQFIVVCVQIQRFTEAFRVRDTQQAGTITIGFEEFVTLLISCSI